MQFLSRYGITPEMFPYMSSSFMAVIKPSLTEAEAWTDEVGEAWNLLFQLITLGMQRGFIKQAPGKPADIIADAEGCKEGLDNAKE